MTTSNNLEDLDHLELLEMVAVKYRQIADSKCTCEKLVCEYHNFHSEIANKLEQIVKECHEFHGA